MTIAEMVPDFFWAPYSFGPQEIWARVNWVPQKYGLQEIWPCMPYNDFHAGTKFLETIFLGTKHLWDQKSKWSK